MHGSENLGHRRPSIPDHELLKPIGQGSYGEVWLARNVMGTFRAVKVVYRDRFESDRPYEREYSGIQKFEPISRTHEGLVDVLHMGRNDREGYFYYVMELADDALGREMGDGSVYEPKTLANEVQRQKRLPIRQCLELGITLSGALEHLHAGGLVHRDIKPSNIIFVNGTAKLADIGLVASFSAAFSFVGTEGFIPPEGPGSVQADIYSLGKVLYECATGKDRHDFPALPTLLGTSEEQSSLLELNEVVLKACARDTGKRYSQAGKMREELELLRAGLSVSRVRTLEKRLKWFTRVAVGLGLMVLVGGAGYWIYSVNARLQREVEARSQEVTVRVQEVKKTTAALNQIQLEQVEALVKDGQLNEALAAFAEVLRIDPNNKVAGKSIVSLLTRNSFSLPVSLADPRVQGVLGRLNPRTNVILEVNSNIVSLLDGTTRKPVIPDIIDNPTVTAWFSYDGCELLTMANSRPLRVWDPQTGRLLRAYEDAWRIGYSPHGSSIVGYNFKSLQKLTPIGPSISPIVNSDIRIDNLIANTDTAIAWSSDGAVRIYGLGNGKLLGQISPDQIAAITEGRTILEIENMDRRGPILEIDASKDGRILAIQIGQFKIHLWDMITMKPLGPPIIPSPNDFRSFKLDPSGSKLFVCGINSSQDAAWVYDVPSGRLLYTVKFGDPGEISGFRFSSDGHTLLLSFETGVMQVMNAETGELLHQSLQPFVSPKRSRLSHLVEFSSDSRWSKFLVLGDLRVPVAIAVSDLLPGKALSQRFAVPEFEYGVVSPDENLLFVSTPVIPERAGEVTLWNLKTKERACAVPFEGPKDWRSRRAGRGAHWSRSRFSSDSQHFFVRWDLGVRIHNSRTGQLETTVSEEVLDLCLRSDAWYALVALVQGDAIRLMVKDLRPDSTFKPYALAHEGAVNGMFSMDGHVLVTFSKLKDRIARIVETQTGKLVHSITNFQPYSVDARPFVEFGSDNQSLVRSAIGSRYSPTSVYDWQEGKTRITELVEEPHNGTVVLQAVSQKAPVCLIEDKKGNMQMWNLTTGNRMGPSIPLYGPKSGRSFLSDGQHLLLSSMNKIIGPDEEPFDPNRPGNSVIWDIESLHPVGWGYPRFLGTVPFRNWVPGILASNVIEVCELVLPGGNPATWLVDLAEAVSGLSRQGDKLTQVPWQTRLDTLEKCRQIKGEDDYSQWVKWFLADRATRTISPKATMTVPQYVQMCIEENTVQSLHEALSLSPANPIALAKLKALEKAETAMP